MQLSRAPGRCAAARPKAHAMRCCLPRPGQHSSRAARLVVAAAGQTSSSGSFADTAAKFAETAQQRMQSFVQEQKLDEKANAAAQDAKKVAKQFAEETSQAARRTYMKIESEHNVSERLDKTKRWVSQTARDIDQEWSLSRRLRSTVDDVQRMLPTWKRQAAAFSNTQLGKASITLLLVGLIFSGLLWQLLNVFWLLWWVSVPVSLYLASQRTKAAGGAAAPGAGFGSSSSSSSSGAGSSSWGGFGSSSSSSAGGAGASRGRYDEGPVVEAEWTSLDDDDNSSRRRR